MRQMNIGPCGHAVFYVYFSRTTKATN